MKRTFILPSENLNYFEHDCRLESLKWRNRNSLYDVSLLSCLLRKTKSSLNLIYDNYLHQEEKIDLNISAKTTEKTDNTLTENSNNNNNETTTITDNDNTETDDSARLKLAAIPNKINNSLSLIGNIDNNTVNSNMINSETENKKASSSKLIKEKIINENNPSFGNVYWPYAITSTSSDDVVCIDSFSNRFLVFNRDFIFKYQVGSKGSETSQFDEPVDLIINEAGRLYVADKNNCRIQIFCETKRYKEVKVQIKSTLETSRSTIDSLAQKKFLPIQQQTRLFKSGAEFSFYEQIRLKDKPIKLTTSSLACVVAVATENGFIFIINESNQIMSFLKLKNNKFNLMDLRNICLDQSGERLICLKTRENQIAIKTYKIEPENENDGRSSLASNYEIKKLELLDKHILDKEYMPGICLSKIACVRLSLDSKNLLIFDAINTNLLEFNLNDGKFIKIVLKAEEHLGNLLAFDFSGDRQHLITTEVSRNSKISLLDRNSCLIGDFTKNNNNKKMRSYEFRLRSYRYRDCDCHRQQAPKSRLTMANRSIGYQSLNNFSLMSDSAEFLFNN